MTRKVFAGVNILDFSWVGVGPITSKYFADHGATTIRVESTTRPDNIRTTGPFRDNVPGLNRSGFYANFNSSKYGMSLNLNLPKGLEIARRLVKWADVVTDSYTPRAMKKWGLEYEDLCKIKPDIIMYRTCLMGQTGPYNLLAGSGGLGSALAGYYYLVGWPDRQPTGPFGPYTDFINPRLGAAALAAALAYRKRTGKGTMIDLSQVEGAIQLIAPTILEWTVNKRNTNRMGNRSPYMAPHGSYRCAGDDRWIAIAVRNDDEWDALCRAFGEPEWGRDPRFGTMLDRLECQDELDALITQATSGQDAYELMRCLQEEGVPAGVVQKPSDLFQDPQLAWRHHFWVLDHPEMGPSAYDGPSFKLSRTPGELTRPAPCLGQDNTWVLKDVLGMSDDEIADCIIGGVLE